MRDFRHALQLRGYIIDRKTLATRCKGKPLCDVIEAAETEFRGGLRRPLMQIALSDRTDKEATEIRKWLLSRYDEQFNVNRPTTFNKTVNNVDNRSVVLPRALTEKEYAALLTHQVKT